MIFELTILGSSSATPAYNRNPSAQLLNINEKYYLIDCGEATQNQLNRFRIRASRIDYIFITHLHGDHYLGLVGLLSSLHLAGRDKALELFGPPELLEIINIQLKYSQTELRFELIFTPIHADEPKIIFENNDITVQTIILNHRIPCTGFVFREKPRQRKINREKLEFYGIPNAYIPLLKAGNDYEDVSSGKRVPNTELTSAALAPRSFAYCSDTLYTESFLQQIKGVSILYHEATFMHDMLPRAEETLHTTALQAGELAKKANVGKLIIGHFSARYKELEPLLEECKSAGFEESYLAIEGTKFRA